jgi:hypothetical protein
VEMKNQDLIFWMRSQNVQRCPHIASSIDRKSCIWSRPVAL